MTIFDIERALTGAGFAHSQAPHPDCVRMHRGNVNAWASISPRLGPHDLCWYVVVRIEQCDEDGRHLHMLRTAPELKDAWAAMLATQLGCVTVADVLGVAP